MKGSKQGLVHVSDINEKRINNAFEVVRKNDKVKVKVIYNLGNKLKLSMKDVD